MWIDPADPEELFVGGDAATLLHRVGPEWIPMDPAPLTAVDAIVGTGRALLLVGPGAPVVTDLHRTSMGTTTEVVCDDYWDNDRDGTTDACDPDCVGNVAGERCANGIDDDCDQLTDCADPDCALAGACN